jgi:hypothetical protein
MTHLHLCLVSKQPSPNLTPLLDPAIPADEVILLHTAHFKPQAEWLAKALSFYQVKSRFLQLPSHEDLGQLRAFFIELIAQLHRDIPDLRLYANLTSGTKPMSLALYEVALMTETEGSQAYYVNMDDTLSWYLPKDKPRHAIADRIKLTPFLIAHGWQPVEPPQGSRYPQWRTLVETWGANLRYWRKPLTQLNSIAVSANNPQHQSEPIKKLDEPLQQLLNALQQAGLLTRKKHSVTFAHADARFFCNGGWLEELVFHTLKQLRAGERKIQDIALGLEIQSQQNDIKNELDTAVLHDNKLIIIECKTHNTKKNNQAIRDSLYKLDTLTEIGGVAGRGILISMHPVTKSDQKRANQYRIPIIQGDQIEHLKAQLQALL